MSNHLAFRSCLIVAALMAASIFYSAVVVAQNPEKTTTQSHPFAKHIEELYVKYLDLARKGNVKATLPLMTSEYAKMADKITPELLKGMSAEDLDPRDARFVGVDVNAAKNSARAIYQKLGAAKKESAAIVFRHEGGQWKIAKLFKRAVSGSESGDGLQELIKESDAFMAR